jgi:hypothetical protein
VNSRSRNVMPLALFWISCLRVSVLHVASNWGRMAEVRGRRSRKRDCQTEYHFPARKLLPAIKRLRNLLLRYLAFPKVFTPSFQRTAPAIKDLKPFMPVAMRAEMRQSRCIFSGLQSPSPLWHLQSSSLGSFQASGAVL